MNRKMYLVALLMLAITVGWSQNPKLKKADRFFEARKHKEAIELYQEVLAKNDLPEAKVKLGDAYRKILDYTNAEQWYSQAVTAPDVNPIVLYSYARVLQYNGKCAEAEQVYQQYLRLRPYDTRKKYLQRACAYADELLQKNTSAYSVQLATFNTPGADLGPAFYKNGLVFASVGNQGYFDLQFVEVLAQSEALEYGKSQRFSDKLRSQYHDAMVTFNADFTEVFLTRSRKNDMTALKEFKPLEIVRAQNLNDSTWSAVEPLPFNSDDYSVAHPALTPDGKRLFFSSNMPGGFGGRDLYFSEKMGEQWGPPINLGPNINTEGDELYPYYQGDRLYFASDGHLGLGGMDIFYVEDLSNGDWSEVENLGAPVNSAYDDFGIVLKPDGRFGYFTSNRPNGAGSDDIYSFAQSQAHINLTVVDATNEQALPEAIIEQLEGPEITLKRHHNQATTNLIGGQCVTFSITLKGYNAQTQEICATEAGDQKIVIGLQREITRLVGQVLDQNTNQPIAGATLKLNGKNCGSLNITSDANGKYNIVLKDACCYDIRVEKNNFFTQNINEPVCTEGIFGAIERNIYLQPFTAPQETVAPKAVASVREVKNDFAPEEMKNFTRSAKNYEGGSIAYLLNLYYDSGHASVRKEALPELEKLLRLLQDNPDLIVEISSHTDSRGDSRYNQKLSQRRADAVATWLVQRGIKKERLVAVGYGEARLINPCEIEEDCSEEAHQMNRRTEFRVLGKLK
ncbi:MAG: OmpA family protein [Saprospiraceae bacterium]